jgi:pimeloyl-ACP methyl ester carboxylesterase
LGENDVERGDGEVKLLDLPAWQGDEARELVEPEAVDCVMQMQLEPIEVGGVGPVETSFVSAKAENPVDAPPVMLIHGFDSSVLEFRYVLPSLTAAGLHVEAMEWWTGGFTDRAPFLQALEADPSVTPWDLIRKHQYAFWKKQLGDQKVTLLGASLGGAVAMDFAATHPECVDRLILMDAGGESYAQPDPFLTSLAADPVTNLFQWRATNGLLPYPHVWSKETNWRQALRAYLKSGGYQNKVNPEFIKTVPQPTLVLWGEEDDVLPVEDASKYKEDLPNCVGVTLIPEAQHAPALENPAFVADQIIAFATKRLRKPQPA